MSPALAKKIVKKRANALLDFKIKGAIATASRGMQCSVTIPFSLGEEGFLKQQLEYLEILGYDAFMESGDTSLKLHLGW